MNDDLNYPRVLQIATEMPWAILAQKLVIIRDILILRSQGIKWTDEEIRHRIEAEQQPPRQGQPQSRQSNIAVIPLVGPIVPRTNFSQISSNLTSVSQFRKQFRSAMADEEIDGILIDIDSPGGQVGQIPEMADEIFETRGKKPIVAVANNLAVSGAYWLGAAADEFMVSPSGEVGSIGVFALHEDISRALAIEGVNISLISAGKYKVEGNPFEALSQEAKDAIQSRVNDYYNMFTEAIARYRGESMDAVQGGFGQGRVVGARDAIQMNMADRIGTFDDGLMAVAESVEGIQAKTFTTTNNQQALVKSAGEPSGLPVIAGKDEIMSKITLPDGTKMSIEEVQALVEEKELTRLELQEEKVNAIGEKASSRGVAPYAIDVAKQLLTQLDMDAEKTITLDLGEEEGRVQTNLFGAVKRFLESVPGRAGEITYTKEVGPPPEERENKNPYRVQKAKTTEEAEALAIERRKELGLTRNGTSTDTIELG